ncbi:MAG: hypothetical protein WD061_01625 [Candidatus Saccharimonadales bacterium]
MKLTKSSYKDTLNISLIVSTFFVLSVIAAGNYQIVLAQTHPEGSYGAGGYGSDIYSGSMEEEGGEEEVTETLSFCVYTGSDCAGGGSVIDFGTLGIDNTSTGLSRFDVATNATNGVTVSIFGTTLDNGSSTIDPFGLTPAASTPGIEQFGLRVSSISGGSMSAASTFNDMSPNQYMFDAGTYIDVGSSSGSTNSSTFEIEYAANISAITSPGIYVSDINYIATATF